MKMLIHLLNPETERRDSEKTGASVTREEFAKVKVNLVFTCLDSQSAYDWMVELAIRAKSAFRDPRRRGFDAPYFDAQALGRTPARDINSMNRYSAGHLLSCPVVPGLPGHGR
jgi:hypothetical protein